MAQDLFDRSTRPRDRDPVDRRIVSQARNRTGNVIDSQNETGGWPELAETTRSFSVPNDPHGDADNDGYTNLEEVLHAMAASIERP